MVVPAHSLLTWSGVYGSATNVVETWQFSVKSSGNLPLESENWDALALAMSQAWTANLQLKQPQDVVLTGCEFVQVKDTGLYDTNTDGAYRRGLWDGAVAGAQDPTVRYPLSVALCVSLTTARPGPTGKGRFYLPAPVIPLDTGFRLNDASVTSMAQAVIDFLGDVEAIAGPVIVASSKGYVSEVTGVKIGKVLDTMRSRRGDQIEGYISLPLA